MFVISSAIEGCFNLIPPPYGNSKGLHNEEEMDHDAKIAVLKERITSRETCRPT